LSTWLQNLNKTCQITLKTYGALADMLEGMLKEATPERIVQELAKARPGRPWTLEMIADLRRFGGLYRASPKTVEEMLLVLLAEGLKHLPPNPSIEECASVLDTQVQTLMKALRGAEMLGAYKRSAAESE
jgi:hypothetical protein